MGLLCEIYQVGIFHFIQNRLNFKKLSSMQGKYESDWKEPQKCVAEPQQTHNAADAEI